jgi:hypothetical protein
MEEEKWKDYLEQFESKVMLAGVFKRVFGKETMVPVKDGKLSKTDFGKFLGKEIDSHTINAFDYYGHIKKSKGLLATIEAHDQFELKSIKSNMVHFASVKIEHIADLCPNLVVDFPKFKRFLLDLRGFKKSD